MRKRKTMAESLTQSSEPSVQDIQTRTIESEREHTKSHKSTSIRFSPDIVAKIEQLKIAGGRETGKVPTQTALLNELINKAYDEAMARGTVDSLRG